MSFDAISPLTSSANYDAEISAQDKSKEEQSAIALLTSFLPSTSTPSVSITRSGKRQRTVKKMESCLAQWVKGDQAKELERSKIRDEIITSYMHRKEQLCLQERQSFETELDSWIEEAPVSEREIRVKAREIILESYDKESLVLAGLEITALPKAIGRMKRLEKLVLRGSHISTLPSEIGSLKKLITLDLEENQLTSLPAEIKKLKKLTNLQLSGNQLQSFPEEITDLENLKKLDLSGNLLTSFPEEITDLANLTSLSLNNMPLGNIPKTICELEKLESLKLEGCQLDRLPLELFELRNLRSLNLANNRLFADPRGSADLPFHRLANLETLSFARNNLFIVPLNISRLSFLCSLNLEHNKLTSLPIALLEREWVEDSMIHAKHNNFSAFAMTAIRHNLSENPYPFPPEIELEEDVEEENEEDEGLLPS